MPPRKNILNGIDRINNKIGYLPENCTPCCQYCNSAKNNLDIDDFIRWMNKIHNNMNNIIEVPNIQI